ncbi:hypothetical protein BDA99DRAFT_517551 [Phascolomyces articulosus]|uniref:SH3 domain-containing protein n=1 Tax=Phascolomyces articulosus TaxID=60185 RepID=A0AAD5PD90_9FUNG|nr:hypothetical protein BDA99DRAFT_517551 [Phascolomyces articulosus]
MTSAVRAGETHWQQQQHSHHHSHHNNRWEDNGYREIHIDDEDDDDIMNHHPHHHHDNTVTGGGGRRSERDIEEEDEEEDEDMVIEDASSMSSSPSIPDENINFDLVYALHTFVATVEGQASVVKGDALILMEDTNIYWWLVEVLKTREVGYIPAENIETPYERLARLNKHRNVEITSPSEANEFVPHEKKSHKNVTIATGASATRIIHYEVESEEEYESGAEEEGEEDDEEDDDENDTFEDAHQDIMDSSDPYNPQHQQQQYVQQSSEQEQLHHNQHSDLLTVPEGTATLEPTEELRVFAGNIGQAPLFHTFSINLSTTADVLVREAATSFDLYNRPEYAEGTIEYYIAVQGLDGDDYVLAPQDKPLSIFKTLTAPLTTPMPSVSHIRRTSPQQQQQEQEQQTGIGGNSSIATSAAADTSSTSGKNEGRSSRRPRSSSFSNYEQTSYDEDSVIRFYLHRRIKRAHEREGIFYIKVSLYPDEGGSSPSIPPASTNAPAFTTNPTPAPTGKKKKLMASRQQEIDRIDKIMAVKQEQQIGSVITMALEKFHVPDAEAEGYCPQQQQQSPPQQMMGPTDRCLTKYRMSVRANGIETRLDPRDHMASALHKQQAHGPVTSDLLFILRRADDPHNQQHHHDYPPPLLSPMGGNKFNHNYHHSVDPNNNSNISNNEFMMPEERRPSILDILMDSPRSTELRRPSFMTSSPGTPVDDRRPSIPSSLASNSTTGVGGNNQERKSSLTPPCQQGAINNSSALSPPPISGFRRTSVMSGTSSVYSDCASAVTAGAVMDQSSSNWDVSSSSSHIIRSASLQPGDTASTAAHQAVATTMQRSATSTNNKKESSFKQSLKRLVGWGSKTKKTPPPPLESPSSSTSLNMIQQNGSSLSVKPTPSSPFLDTTASQVSIVSAPPTPLTPTPGKNNNSNGYNHKAISPRRADHPLPSTPVERSQTPASSTTMGAPFSPVVGAAASASGTSMIDPEIVKESHVSSLSSLSSDDDDDDEGDVGKDPMDLSDDSSDSDSDEDDDEDRPPKPPPKQIGDSDIQAQYTMWMDSQNTDQGESKHASKTECDIPPEPPLKQDIASSPSSTLTTSSGATTSIASTTCTSSNNPNNNSNTNTSTTTATTVTSTTNEKEMVADGSGEENLTPPNGTPAAGGGSPQQPPSEIDDLFLLVTRGVDYLQSRESSKWEDEGGYEFHPWNRPDGSFAVRKKSQTSLLAEETTSDQSATSNETSTDDQTDSHHEDSASTATSTNNNKQNEDNNGSPKERSNSTNSSKIPSKQQMVRRPAAAVATPTQNEALIDEQELQRIVAAHIVF